MKFNWKDILICFALSILLPGFLANLFLNIKTENTQINTNDVLDVHSVKLILKDGSTRSLPLNEYLIGVLLAEMPMDFHNEALKAQAVAARTVTLYNKEYGSKHNNGDICEDPACCQAYISMESYLAAGGTQERINKAASAVALTANQVITYDGKLIQALYFSCSGGRTEDAVAVWGTDIPYLQAVDSPGEEKATHFTDTVVFSKTDFCNKLNIDKDETLLIQNVHYTDGGSVEKICINGKDFTGVAMRALLGLRSTAFSVYVIADQVTISTRGFGHRVGMSQYGADAMAETGSGYQQILTHYYTGAEVKEYKPADN